MGLRLGREGGRGEGIDGGEGRGERGERIKGEREERGERGEGTLIMKTLASKCITLARLN